MTMSEAQRQEDDRAAWQMATVGELATYVAAPGTWGSVLGLIVGLLFVYGLEPAMSLLLLSVAWLGGVAICHGAERHRQAHDPQAIVLDEVIAMAAVLALQPWVVSSWPWLLVAFALFRFFDVSKFPPVNLLARLPTGWGIMADDLGAAAYACLLLWGARHYLPV